MNPKVFIIAEAGVNHNGSLKMAKMMVDEAVRFGADAVKFQTFQAQALASAFAPKAEYQKLTTGNTGNQLEMIKSLELSPQAHRELFRYCRKKKINFLSSPFDLESIDLLVRLGLKVFKIPSGELTNLPYLRKLGAQRKKIIISTGMSTLQEVKTALDILIKSGARKSNITVLHCNTEYPTPFKDANLLAMLTIKNKLGVKVGYSDHTLGFEAAIAAVALGARVIEKHFTLDRKMKGPDHLASLEPSEFKRMVQSIRNIEYALGSKVKKPSQSEKKNMRLVRKSIFAADTIKRGDTFTPENITAKRPGYGLSPMLWDFIIGKKAKRNYKAGQLIKR